MLMLFLLVKLQWFVQGIFVFRSLKVSKFQKQLYLALISPKKQTKNFYPRILVTMIEVFCSFLEELRTRWFASEIIWPLVGRKLFDMEKKDFDAAGASAIHCAPSMLGKAGKASSCTVQWENLFSYLFFSNLIVLLKCPAFGRILSFVIRHSETVIKAVVSRFIILITF